MTIGEKMKRIRTFRGMTQKGLGDKLGLGASGATRIAQYEMGYRVPKKDLVEKLATAFGVSLYALLDNTGDMASQIIEQLFWMEEETPGIIKLTPMQRDTTPYNADQSMTVRYADNDTWPPRPPVALWFDYTLVDEFLQDWATRQQQLEARQISREEYFEWKLRWPDVAGDI